MAALPQVQAKSGQMYDADSPQGRMIAQAKERAAASAASKQPFSSGSSALGGEGIKPIFENISSQLTSIGENVTTIVDIQQADTRGDALNSANVPQDDLVPEGPDDDGIYREDEGGGAGGGGFFSKLFGGAGGILAGAGALVGGFGVLLAGGGKLLEAFNNFDGEKFKKNIESIMSIVPSITSPGAAAAFAVDTGLFLITMTQLGLGMAAFGIGQGVAGIAQKFVDFDAQGIKDNVITLLSIGDLYGDSWAGKAALVGNSAVFLLAMTGLGAGLAIFGAGAAVGATGDAITQGIDKINGPGFAQNIKDNVTTLLSIGDLYGDSWSGKAALVGNAATFLLAMTGLGAGLAIFGAGATVGAAADAVGQGIDKVTEVGWAQSIVDNVTTLLSISDLVGGKLEALKETGTFALIMTGIAAGLGVFSFGAAVAGATTGVLDVTDWATRGEGMTWSQSIVDHVTTLLSIASIPNVGADTAAFAGTMSGISAGLVAFGVGSFFAAGADGLSNFISSAEEGEGSWADKIKEKVTTLLSIINPEEGGATVRDATNFSLIMGKLSAGLMKFSGGEFVSSLLSVGSSVLNFLRGADSPVAEMLNIAESADDLEKGANAIESLTNSLSRISLLAFDGSKIKMKAFAKDLAESVPVIEKAIMGGRIKEGLLDLGKGNIEFKGLASPDINFSDAIQNIRALRGALGVELLAAPNGATSQLQSMSSEMMTSGGPVIINNIADNSTTSTRGGDAIVSDMAIDQADLQTMFLLQQGEVSAITR